MVVSFETLSHVADQPGFVAKPRRLLVPDGLLLLATQNRPALGRNKISPPQPGQLRHWVDRAELEGLLAPHFEIEEIRSITPRFNSGLRRVVNSRKVRGAVDTVGLGGLSRWVKDAQETRWMRFTIVVAARPLGAAP